MSKLNIFLLEAYKRGYRVSLCGSHITFHGKKIKQKDISNTGYPRISIRIGLEIKGIAWHRLQAYQKYKNLLFEQGIVVRHVNSIKTDCSYDNILIGTMKDNNMDKTKEDRLKYSLNATESWRKHNATEIKIFHSISKSYQETMNRFNISSKGTLHFILKSAKYS